MISGETESSMDGRADGERQRGDLGKRERTSEEVKLPSKSHHQKFGEEWRFPDFARPNTSRTRRSLRYRTASVVFCCDRACAAEL